MLAGVMLACLTSAVGQGNRPAKTSKNKEKNMPATAMVKITLQSPAFAANAPIPKDCSGEGKDLSPELTWSDAPAKTQSFALIMDDPDAPPGTWVHWVIYDIPAGAKMLKAGVVRDEKLPDGSKQGLGWGVDKFEKVGYYGPYPPTGKLHRYFFKLYALDKLLGLSPQATKPEVMKAMLGHIIGQGELVGTYRR